MMNTLARALPDSDLFSSLSIMGLRGGMLVAKFLLALFIARFMGLEALGIYGLIAGAAAVGQVVMRFGVFATLSREAVTLPLRDLTHNLRHYALGCIAAYLCLLPLFLAMGLYSGHFTIAALSFGVIVLEHAMYDVFVLTNNLQRPKLANMLYALQSAVWIYLFIVLAFLFPVLRSLEMVLGFWMTGGIVALAVTGTITRHWPWKAAFGKPLDRAWYAPAMQKSWRLYVGEVITAGTLYLDRYLITFFLSLELVGVYVLFWQVTSAICNLVGAGVLQMFRPRLILAHRQGDGKRFMQTYTSCILRCLAGTLGLGAVAAVAVPYLVTYSDQPLAMDYLSLFWLMLAAMIFRIGMDVAKVALFAQSRDRENLRSNLLSLVLGTTLTVLLLWQMGIYGVVIAAVATQGTVILYAESMRRKPQLPTLTGEKR